MSDYTTAQILESLQKDNRRLNSFVSEAMGVETAESESFTSLIQKAEENYSGGGDDETLRYYKALLEHDTDVLDEITELPEGIRAINSYIFRGCSEMTLNAIPDTVYGIGEYAFYGCTNLALTSLPESLATIATYAFYNCSKITINEIPVGVKLLTPYCFRGCSKITEITALGVTEIQSNAFAATGLTTFNAPNCTKLTSDNMFPATTKKITLGALTSTHQSSFRLVVNLEELYVGVGTTSSIYLNYSSKLTQESRHGIIENLADMTGKTAPKLVFHESCTGVDRYHYDMVNNKNYEHNCTLEVEIPNPNVEVEG